MQTVTFGMLTASAHGLTFEEMDANHDGVLTATEITSFFKEKNFDVLDLSTIDKDADQKVTKDEYILWDQESKISEALTNVKNRIARDFIGHDRNDMISAINRLDEYQKEFVSNFTTRGEDITRMAEIFCKNLPAKYHEIKNDILNNNDTSVKKRVIDSIINDIMYDSNSGYKELLNKTTRKFTENSKRLFVNILESEADKFIKTYKGINLETDLAIHLKNFLAQSDKSKLAGAIKIWDDDCEEMKELPKELGLIKAKNKAKAFLLNALREGIQTIKLGDVTVRTEVAIMPALAQYKSYESLIRDLNNAIKQLSQITPLEQIIQTVEEENDNETEKSSDNKVQTI